MYKDIKMSEELTKDFHASPSARSLIGLELNLKVLTTGHWPNDQKEAIQSLVNLPRELSQAMTCFTQFYYNKFNNGRMLNWKLSLGTSELKAKFDSA